jgi:beta-lactamase superfamily II metal-dependent hydrolase
MKAGRAITTLVCLLAVAMPFGPGTAGAGVLRVTFLAVGQGDAALYQGPCGQLGLIDANGGAVDEVLAAMDAAGHRNLTWVSTSHYDFDHIGDIVDIAESPGVTVGKLFDRGGNRSAKDTDTYRRYYDWATSGAVTRVPVEIGDSFSLCGGSERVVFKVLSVGTDGTAAGGVPVTEENDKGLCLKVTYGDFDLATCGDINGTDEGSRTDVESAVASNIGNIEFAKVNHHGSRFSSNSTYVSTLKAQASVVSVGKNSFGHPDLAVVDGWRAQGRLFQTHRPSDGSFLDGNVRISTSGFDSFTVNTSASGVTRHFPMDILDGFRAYGFTGGAFVATGDVDGDAVDEIITGADAGGGPHVKVFEKNGKVIQSFFAYNPSFRGGVRVGAADVNGDGFDDIITGAGPGGGPHVKVFSGKNHSLLRSFFAHHRLFRGGLFVAGGDVNNDGIGDVITGAGAGGGPHVLVIRGGRTLVRSFFAYSSSFRGGVRVGAADLNNDGHDDILTGAGPSGGPHVKGFSGKTNAIMTSFFAYAPAFRGGVFLAGGQVRGSGNEEIVTGAGGGGGPHVRVGAGDVDGGGDGEVVTTPGPGRTVLVRILD